ncbi:MAG: YqjF family protein [Opitutia bacterium]|jgi:uncharacterized protein YqjF (DUF2071 family)
MAIQPEPAGQPSLFQSWDDLLFLHWEIPPAEAARRLPEGLVPDLHEGRTYAGLVAFAMRRVRPRGLPWVPWISNFLELNVRLYVRGPRGRPGVFFLSLDCDRGLAVEVARRRYHLPYRHAEMSRAGGSGGWDYRCRRKGEAEAARLSWTSGGAPRAANPGTLEHFLAERYTFFTPGPRGLLAGEVRHAPYLLTQASLREGSDLPLRWDGLPDLGEPCHAMASPGVSVRCWSLVDADLPPVRGVV